MRRETPDRACAGRSEREDRVPLADDELACELVTAERWDDLAQLFECSAGTASGVTPSTCWCMVWRDTQPVKRTTPAIRRARLRTIVDAGTPVGVIGYLEGRAVAWCSVAPRASYARTDAFGFAGGRYEAGTDVWTIVCFYALPERGRQASARLVEALRVRGPGRRRGGGLPGRRRRELELQLHGVCANLSPSGIRRRGSEQEAAPLDAPPAAHVGGRPTRAPGCGIIYRAATSARGHFR